MAAELLLLALLVGGALLASWRAGQVRGRQRWDGVDGVFVVLVLVVASSLAASAATGVAGLPAGSERMELAVLGTALGGLLSLACVLVRADAGLLGLRQAGAARWWLGAVALAVVFFGVSLGWGWLLEQGAQAQEQALVTTIRERWPAGSAVGMVAYGLLVAPVVEEVLFRGFLLVPLVRRLGTVGGALASAVLFGVMHLSDPQAVPPLVVLGVGLAWLRLGSGSLGPPLALHVLNNAAAIGMLLLTR